MEPTERHWMFALDYPAQRPERSMVTMDFQILTRPITRLKRYPMISNPDYQPDQDLGIILRTDALRLPEGFNPRTWNLVRRWREETPDDAAFVRRVLDWFNREAFFYTLNPPLLSRDTVDEFLFDTRRGFCEHYASAFTVMMRMAGIPARVVTGYMGGLNNGSYFLVRQSDAHAWSEVWLDDVGWQRVDPTAAVAPGRIEGGSLQALAGRRHFFDYEWVRNVRASFDLLQRRWNEWVIDFGLDRQSRLFRPFGFEQVSSTWLVITLTAAIAIVAALMTPFLLRLRIRTERDPAAREWDRLRRKLDRAGVPTTAAMTPTELQKAAAELPDSDQALARITRLYRQFRYAPEGPTLSELKQAIRGFRPARARR